MKRNFQIIWDKNALHEFKEILKDEQKKGA